MVSVREPLSTAKEAGTEPNDISAARILPSARLDIVYQVIPELDTWNSKQAYAEADTQFAAI
jgi:hypothetical protein